MVRSISFSRSDPSLDDPFYQEIVRRILSVGNPERIILFGSYARGTPGPYSDLDLMIVERSNTRPGHLQATNYRMALTGIHPRKDIIVVDQGEVDRWRDQEGAFITTALREGKILYEAA